LRFPPSSLFLLSLGHGSECYILASIRRNSPVSPQVHCQRTSHLANILLSCPRLGCNLSPGKIWLHETIKLLLRWLYDLYYPYTHLPDTHASAGVKTWFCPIRYFPVKALRWVSPTPAAEAHLSGVDLSKLIGSYPSRPPLARIGEAIFVLAVTVAVKSYQYFSPGQLQILVFGHISGSPVFTLESVSNCKLSSTIVFTSGTWKRALITSAIRIDVLQRTIEHNAPMDFERFASPRSGRAETFVEYMQLTGEIDNAFLICGPVTSWLGSRFYHSGHE